jgi:hypothetical protein
VSLLEWGSDELLVDNSIYARRDHPIVEARWQKGTEEGQLILVAPMLMEVLYSAKERQGCPTGAGGPEGGLPEHLGGTAAQPGLITRARRGRQGPAQVLTAPARNAGRHQ